MSPITFKPLLNDNHFQRGTLMYNRKLCALLDDGTHMKHTITSALACPNPADDGKESMAACESRDRALCKSMQEQLLFQKSKAAD